MSCSNCFNGCTDIKSDQCVKYTGNDIVSLGISEGDPLSTVILQLSTYLVDAMDGSGITPDVDDTCALIAGYLGAGTSLNDFISALIQAACDLQTQIDAIDASLTTLNSDYDVDCLDGVVDSDDTHDVLQAVIVKLCSTEDTLTALAVTLDANYVKLADLNSLIAAYLASSGSSTLMANRMVPYVAVPYFGSLTYFDITGAGTGNWANVYLCNGANGTPDMRGRVPVCAIQGMAGGTLNSAVNPATTTNPNYVLNDIQGANAVTLIVNQIPSHTHTAAVTVDDPTHAHFVVKDPGITNVAISSTNYVRVDNSGSGADYTLKGTTGIANAGLTSASSTGITTSVSNSYAGSGASHSNIQPVIASYYIMYVP